MLRYNIIVFDEVLISNVATKAAFVFGAQGAQRALESRLFAAFHFQVPGQIFLPPVTIMAPRARVAAVIIVVDGGGHKTVIGE